MGSLEERLKKFAIQEGVEAAKRFFTMLSEELGDKGETKEAKVDFMPKAITEQKKPEEKSSKATYA